ncbi:MAG: FAD-binding oxidoreductase [Ktedonobacteraceae bacterium]
MVTADIVIVGGGIIGASIAYQLAQRGAGKTVLIERDTIASGSSGRATGGIRQQFADERDIRFSIEGVRFYEQFTQERDDNIARPRFHQHGYLFLVTNEVSWQAMRRHVALQQSLGVPTQLLNRDEVIQRIPQLYVDDIVGATFCPTDGYSDPGAMTRALALAAQRRGVLLYEHAPVLGIAVEHGKVQSVQMSQETVYTHMVINATGAYSSLLARLVGIVDLPVYPIRRQLYLTEPYADLPNDVPMTVDLSTGFHFRRRADRVLVTSPLPFDEAKLRHSQLPLTPDAFELSIDNNFWHTTLQRQIQKRCPSLVHVGIAQVWSGLYEMTPDEHPILGKTEIEGFLCASGFSGHGFMQAPMAAKLLTELILDGTSTTHPIEPFALERFRTGRVLETTRLL